MFFRLKLTLTLCLLWITSPIFAVKPIVNVYAWGGEIPKELLHQFEKETGIHVNFSTYDNNETMYAKLRASPLPIYDVILPSAYFVERLKNQHYLVRLDKTALPNAQHISAQFNDYDYDRGNQYSVPLIWGATGIFYNAKYIVDPITGWSDLWKANWRKQLLLLDDPREVFAMSLLSLGLNPNDDNPLHIEQAYHHLKQLRPNIKLFASESIQALLIDEDAKLGSVWNGDVFKAQQENSKIQFVYPKEGFMIWIDCLAILKNAPHLKEAYAFVDFMLRPESAKIIALQEGHAITNHTALMQLPDNIRNNEMIYPSEDVLKRGLVQRDIRNEALWLYNYYWQNLKFSM